ncbi:MAG: VgrG-related protein, partial [Dehalococcoidia bacterium]|nr:VgrG-related protein [Dehalococcoidia bacterium]
MPSELSSQILLKFDGKKAEKDLTDSIISVEVDNSVTLPDMFSIHLQDDEDFKWIDSDKFKVGTSVEIVVKTIRGDQKEKAAILSGEITGIEPSIVGTFGPSVVLRGYDKSHRLHRGRNTKAWLQVKDSDIASTIASKAGLGGGTIDATSGVHDYILQDNKTDWEFLLSRARRVGRWVFVKDGKLNFVKNPEDSGPTLTFGDDLMEFSARLSTMRQVNEVEVLGWDPGKQEQIVGKASTVTTGTLPKIGQSQSGGDVQKKAFSSAADIVVDMPVANQSEAKELAQSFRDEREKDFIVADCVSFGNPKVLAGVKIKLEGVGKKFSGTYRVTRTLHRYTNSEYITEFTAGGRHASITELLAEKNENGGYGHWPVFGKVTNISDPDNENRVKIKLPSLNNDVENTWARLVAPGASQDRGLQWLPEVNDEVLVVFERG